MLKIYKSIFSNTTLLEGSNGKVIGLSNFNDLGGRWNKEFFHLRNENSIEIDLRLYESIKVYREGKSLIIFNNDTIDTIYRINSDGDIIDITYMSSDHLKRNLLRYKEDMEVDSILINYK